MGLIKKNNIKETGEIVIEKPRAVGPVEPLAYEPEPLPAEIAPAAVPARDLREEADNLLRRAHLEAEAIREKARQEGLSEARAQAHQEADKKILEALETLNQAVKERKKIIKDAEAEILRLAIRAAEQIIRSEVSLHRDVCLNIVSEAISRVSDREQVIVKVNREDAEYIKRYKDRLAGIVDGIKSFSIIEDSQIEPGGCIVETNLGYVDARIATKLKVLEEALQKLVPAPENP